MNTVTDVLNTKYKILNTKYEINKDLIKDNLQNTKYKILNTKYDLVNSKKLEKRLTNLEVRVRVLEIGNDLLSIELPYNFTPWYCKCYKILGEQKFQAICSMAREGKNPKALFSWLLKQEMNKVKTK